MTAAVLAVAVFGSGPIGIVAAVLAFLAAGAIARQVAKVAQTRMSRHTPLGALMLRRARGFEYYLATAEADDLPREEQLAFPPYLPYAIALGLAPRWSQTFDRLFTERVVAGPPWYSGPRGYSYLGFGAGIGSFATHVSQAVSPPPSSGSSGFSGGGSSGGGGGGGGGSW